MEPRSLQIRSDAMLRSFDGEVRDHADRWAIRTPANPTFRWGNYVVFDRPPTPDDVTLWPRVFAQEIGEPPTITHVAFTWDTVTAERGALDDFVALGYDSWQVATMTMERLAPATRAPTPCEIRTFAGDADWTAWVDLAESQNAVLPDDEREGAGYRLFAERTAASYRAMCDAGWGQWFGAFVDGQLASSMGLFVRDGLGRFQAVDTHPRFRRQGLATTLVRHVADVGFTEMAAEALVIVADVDEAAIGIYAAAGFAETERLWQIELVDRTATA